MYERSSLGTGSIQPKEANLDKMAMGVPSLPCSLGGVHWQSGARRLLPSGALGGAQPQGTPPQDSTP